MSNDRHAAARARNFVVFGMIFLLRCALKHKQYCSKYDFGWSIQRTFVQTGWRKETSQLANVAKCTPTAGKQIVGQLAEKMAGTQKGANATRSVTNVPTT